MMNCRKCILPFCMLLLTIVECVQKQNSPDKKRAGKLFSLFNLIHFPNDSCNNTSGQPGVCYTAAECTARNGLKGDSCAQNFGVCCQFTITAGGQSSENVTYFDSAGASSAPGSYQARICPATRNICQLRLNFMTFIIDGPSTSTVPVGNEVGGSPVQVGTPYTDATQCVVDQFTVTSPGSPSPPTICGTNTGQHMYIESSPNACTTLSFLLGSQATQLGSSRSWRIQVLQYSCDYVNLAPPGCTKYFFIPDIGPIMTYNYGGTPPVHLANQRDRFCIRRERNTCRACFFTVNGADFDLTGTSKMIGLVGVNSMCCGYGLTGTMTTGFDCLVIPGAQKTMKTGLKFDEFCGGGSSALKGGFITTTAIGALPQTVCTPLVPFMVSFYSDGFELPGEQTAAAPMLPNRGFMLQYTLQPC